MMSHQSLLLFFSLFLVGFFLSEKKKVEWGGGGYNEEDASQKGRPNIPRNESVAKSFVYIIFVNV